jgi:uncharacterized flavoprotein (TIGR03862 family)
MASSISSLNAPAVAVVGGGPAGLMAADVLAQAGVPVHVFDAMPSVGRKFLLAGKGGLNLTHSEDPAAFGARYGDRAAQVAPWLAHFGAAEVRAWAQALGVETFVGSSGRVFPRDLKAAPLLRAWLHRLRAAGVQFHMRHRWTGWCDAPQAGPGSLPGLCFQTPTGEIQSWPVRAVVLALGGASWPRLGSDGQWVPWLRARDVAVAPLQPANCGFDAVRPGPEPGTWLPGWSEHLRSRFAGAPLKNVALQVRDPATGEVLFQQAGEAVVTQGGVEGSLVYAASAAVRGLLARGGAAPVAVHLNLLPQREPEWVAREVAHPRGPRSLATHLKSRLGIDGVKAALLHEVLPRDAINDPPRLAAALQALPLLLSAPRPIAEAISSAGGVGFEALDDAGMLKTLPGVFAAGEMIDWEAPTGGYLLTACLASGAQAGEGVKRHLGL